MAMKKPMPLTPAERAIVKERLFFWHGTKWYLTALVVKPTHVHLITRPLLAEGGLYFSLPEILHSTKKGSAWLVNRSRRRRGTLWETEDYNHIIRSQAELEATFDYFLRNAAEEVLSGDPYAYDGFWCEAMGLPEGLAFAVPPDAVPLSPRPVHPRLEEGELLQRERKLPHWELPGATYHVVTSLLGYQPEGEAWPGAVGAKQQ